MIKHTPTPWEAQGFFVVGPYGYRKPIDNTVEVAHCGRIGDNLPKAEQKANAAHIVHCVNAHFRLVLALKHALLALRTDTSNAGLSARQTAAEVVRNALDIAKAKGTK